MNTLLFHMRSNWLRRCCAWLVLLAILVKAFIPMGYMPDMKALEKGVLQIIICTANGFEAINVTSPQTNPDKSNPSNAPHKSKADVCPYGAAPLQALIAPPVQLLQNIFLPVLIFQIFQERLISHAFFSPAQPRAPPSH